MIRENPPKEAQDIFSRHQKTLEVFSRRSGKKLNSISDATFLFDVLKCELEYDLPQPEWTKEVAVDLREEVMAMHLALFTWTEEMKKAKAGPLLGDILDRMLQVVEGRSQQKIFIYSGHDLTLSTVTRTLGLEEQVPKAIEVASALIFELLIVEKRPMVQVGGFIYYFFLF